MHEQLGTRLNEFELLLRRVRAPSGVVRKLVDLGEPRLASGNVASDPALHRLSPELAHLLKQRGDALPRDDVQVELARVRPMHRVVLPEGPLRVKGKLVPQALDVAQPKEHDWVDVVEHTWPASRLARVALRAHVRLSARHPKLIDVNPRGTGAARPTNGRGVPRAIAAPAAIQVAAGHAAQAGVEDAPQGLGCVEVDEEELPLVEDVVGEDWPAACRADRRGAASLRFKRPRDGQREAVAAVLAASLW
mmetsp:Transcript_16957/g.50277  ORF Transcript_16957/g.50277 Transcript_16957/m.50277 type:complete len:249 (-) Transcript_16957:267-1013(-)